MVDPREKRNRNILTRCLEDARKLIGVKHFIILTGQHPKWLLDGTNICLEVALGPEILLQGE
jgi:hypothetical protein